MTTLTNLIGRVEAATGVDREIDARLHVALFDPQDVLLDPGHAGKPLENPKGYVLGNVRFVLTAVNIAMNDWGEGPLIEIARAIAAKHPHPGSPAPFGE